ncbi:MAG TPA: hypothetical protein PLX89_17080, partial [Verrucomicrobiota bacterium]|nr:hypothetical protein [Verrucomicrobiota bacterium]
LGDILGFAANAQVTSTTFCNVTTPLNRQTPATATEQATLLLCPIPPPPLAIAPAVLVSWPGEQIGWSIESAMSMDGPWAASAATPFMQDGRHGIAVPADSTPMFFRLR